MSLDTLSPFYPTFGCHILSIHCVAGFMEYISQIWDTKECVWSLSHVLGTDVENPWNVLWVEVSVMLMGTCGGDPCWFLERGWSPARSKD